MSIFVYDTPSQVAQAAADFVEATLAAYDGPATLGLAGGSTPTATYRLLRAADLDWSQVTAWLGDERWVPEDHDDRNARMVREALLDHVPARLLSPDYEIGDPERAAARYEAALREAFVEREGHAVPDLVLLGMGPDGHTASLFPGTEALEEEDRWYVANWIDALEAWRLTATLPLLWAARKIAFLVTGENKAGVLARIIDEGEPFPAQRVAEGAVDCVWFLDAPAASKLRSVPH